jgi:hypothetical protein
VKRAKHKLKIPSGRTTSKKQDRQNAKPFPFLKNIKIEAEITGNLVKESVSMLSVLQPPPTVKILAGQKPGTSEKAPDNVARDSKIIESELPGGEISPGSKKSKIRNDGVKSPGGNIVGETSGSTSVNNTAGNELPGSKGPNAGGAIDPVGENESESRVDIESIPSTSGLQELKRVKDGGDSSTPPGVLTGETTGAVESSSNNPVYFERKATLFTESKPALFALVAKLKMSLFIFCFIF